MLIRKFWIRQPKANQHFWVQYRSSWKGKDYYVPPVSLCEYFNKSSSICQSINKQTESIKCILHQASNERVSQKLKNSLRRKTAYYVFKLSEKSASKLQISDIELSGHSLATLLAVIQKYVGSKLFQKSICCIVKIRKTKSNIWI